MILEVCAGTFQSALNAEAAGAHRIEYCQSLHLDGLTPELDEVRELLSRLSIPIFVLIRPRAGDFVYTESEFNKMLRDLERFASAGCHGIVSGFLTPSNSIDHFKVRKAIQVCGNLPFTFHRAFDSLNSPKERIDELADLGVKRILTAAGNQSAADELQTLQCYKEYAADRIGILPGGGINPENAGIFKKWGFGEIHASARSRYSARNLNLEKAPLIRHSDKEIIRAILREIN